MPLGTRPVIPAATLAASNARDWRRSRMRTRHSAAFNGCGVSLFSPLDSAVAAHADVDPGDAVPAAATPGHALECLDLDGQKPLAGLARPARTEEFSRKAQFLAQRYPAYLERKAKQSSSLNYRW